MQCSRQELLKQEFASLIDEITVVQGEITKGRDAIKNTIDTEKATASWYDIVKSQIDNMKVELSKIREAYHITGEIQHRNGMGSGTAMAQQRQHNGTSDEDGVVSSTVETDRTEIKGGGNKKLEVNGIVYSVVSEETGEEQERQADVISAQGATRMDVENNAIAYSTPDETFNIEPFDYAQEELYETTDRTESTGGEETSSVSNNEIINNKEKQKESETVNGEQSFEQMESTQSSQLTNSSSSSYNPSPVVHKKGVRVSVHRELDADYERSTDNSNWQLFLGQHILIRSTKDNQWYPGVILDISYRNCRAYRYQVLSEGKRSRVKGSDLALMEPCSDSQGIAVGSRIVGVYGALEVLYAGIVAEIPCKENVYRVLVFYDDGFAQYTTLDKIHLVCESGCNIWEEVARHSREFIQRYLDGYPIRPMVRLKVDEELCVEWRGRWMKAVVTQVDCSLVGVLFVESRMHEWLYRGSTRLEPIFLALTSKKGQQLSIPQKKCKKQVECSSKKRFLIVYDHFDSYMKGSPSCSPNISDNTGIMSHLSNHGNGDDNVTAATLDSEVGAGDDNDDTVSTAINNSLLPGITVTEPLSPLPSISSGHREAVDFVGDACSSECSDLETLTQADRKDLGPCTRTDVSPLMKMELSKQRASLRRSSPSSKGPASKRPCHSREPQQPEEFHKECGPRCVPNALVRLNGVYNPMAIPLLNRWTRKLMEVNAEISHSTHHRTHVYYVAPCGRRLRSIAEVDKYLSLTNTEYLTIDQFCYNSSITIDTNPISRPTTAKYYCEDISHGKERTPVSCINEVQDEPPSQFDYCIDRVCGDGVVINTDQSFLIGCDCTDGCRDSSKCACARLTTEEGTCMVSRVSTTPGYNYRRLEKDQQSAIYECNSNCRCGSNCANKLVQLGLWLRLQVFQTMNKGWGLRCLDDIPKGTFVCTYTGDIHTDAGANKKGYCQGDEYLAELDYIEVMERHKEGYESDVEVSSNDYFSEEFTMSEEDEALSYNDSLLQEQQQQQQQQQQTLQQEDAVSTSTVSVSTIADATTSTTPLKKAGLKLHRLKATPLSQPTTHPTTHDPLPSKTHNKTNSPLAEVVVVCDSTSSDDEDDDEQLPCYFPNYSLKEENVSSSAASSDDDKEEIMEHTCDDPVNSPSPSPGEVEGSCDHESNTKHPEQRLSSNNTNNTLTSSIILHSMRRKLFEENQCYVMDAKLQGNIGRFLNHSCQPNLFVQNVFVDTHDLRFPWVAFFTNQNVKALTELTWDYNYEVGSVPDKVLPCYCGAINCRKRLL